MRRPQVDGSVYCRASTTHLQPYRPKAASIELKLPAGKFEITAIHEKYGKQTTMVEVKDDDKTTIDFKFKAATQSPATSNVTQRSRCGLAA